MNPAIGALNIWSFRKELYYVALAFIAVLSLPLVAVFILTHTGINVVSDALIDVNPETKTITTLNPLDGSDVVEISQEMVWPVTGVVTLRFGESSLYQLFHTGIDIANPDGIVGDPITPFMEGVVTYARETKTGYGKHIIIDHGNNITSVYAHLDRIYVYEGQKVNIGDVVGKMGSTGWSTGPHLHFEIRVYGIPVNPEDVLGEI